MSIFSFLKRFFHRKKPAKIKSGLEYKYKEGLQKTRNTLLSRFTQLFHRKLDAEALEEAKAVLLSSDISPELVERILQRLMEEYKKTPESEWRYLLENILVELLDGSEKGLELVNRPAVIVVVGVNGAGKTTTIAKIGSLLKAAGKRVLLCGADTFRAAGSEQLEIWATRLGLDIVTQQRGADPAAVAYDAVDKAVTKGYDVLIVDTAGRLHTKKNLMEELKKLVRSVQKRAGNPPDEILLVIDGTFGQNALNQASQFAEALNVSGIVITKLDGTAKGGAVLSIFDRFKVPIKFVGLGEKPEDLIPFDRVNFVKGILE